KRGLGPGHVAPTQGDYVGNPKSKAAEQTNRPGGKRKENNPCFDLVLSHNGGRGEQAAKNKRRHLQNAGVMHRSAQARYPMNSNPIGLLEWRSPPAPARQY